MSEHGDESGVASHLRGVCEGVILAMVCGAPWAFGSVDAWAEWALELGIGFVAVLAALVGRIGVRRENLLSGPGLALAGLVGLALVQSVPLPGPVMSVLSPQARALHHALVPDAPQKVRGDLDGPVAPAALTLSQAPDLSRTAAARIGACWLLFHAVIALGGGFPALRRMGWAVALNATILALFSLVQALSWNGKIYWVFPTDAASGWSAGGPFICHNHLAESLNMGLGLALGILLGGGDDRRGLARSNHLWAAYLVGVLTLGVVTSHSRGGFLGMILAFSATFLALRARDWRLWAGLATILGLLAVFLVALGTASPYVARLQTILNPRDSGYAVRTEVWADMLSGARAHPVWGAGLGTFSTTHVRCLSRDQNVTFDHPESEYVEMAFEGGLIGLALALVGLGGLAQRARRAFMKAGSTRDQMLTLGAGAAVMAVFLQCFGDFGLHIPGVVLVVVVLSAHLCRLGWESEAAEAAATTSPPPSPASRLGWAALMAALGAIVSIHGGNSARVEAQMVSVDLPAPDTQRLAPALATLDVPELERIRGALVRAVSVRPTWGEGYLRLGLVELALYRATADAWLKDSVTHPAERGQLTDPLWLLTLIQAGQADANVLLEQEPVRQHLVPAARAFLQARRLRPISALAHAELGALHWLLEPAEPVRTHLERTLKVVGGDSSLALYAGEVARRAGELDLAARSWRKALELSEGTWSVVAASAAKALTPDAILERVIPEDHGHYALAFAERLYTAPEQQEVRHRFLLHAANGIPQDQGLPEGERNHLLAETLHGLDERVKARRRMEVALALEPERLEWREELIQWLLDWNEFDEAHEQALIAKRLSPSGAGVDALIEKTADAVARGPRSTIPRDRRVKASP